MIKPGQVWIAKEQCDGMNHPLAVVIVKIEDDIVFYNYIPRFDTNVTPHGYDNGREIENFKMKYIISETYVVELLLNEYESTTRRDLD
jgi:hypothetical protein